MTPSGWMVDPLLQRALRVRDGLSRAAEAHAAADVVPAGCAEVTLLAGQANLEGDLVANAQGRDGGTCGRNHATGLVTEREGLAHEDVPVAEVAEVVQV